MQFPPTPKWKSSKNKIKPWLHNTNQKKLVFFKNVLKIQDKRGPLIQPRKSLLIQYKASTKKAQKLEISMIIQQVTSVDSDAVNL